MIRYKSASLSEPKGLTVHRLYQNNKSTSSPERCISEELRLEVQTDSEVGWRYLPRSAERIDSEVFKNTYS